MGRALVTIVNIFIDIFEGDRNARKMHGMLSRVGVSGWGM